MPSSLSNKIRKVTHYYDRKIAEYSKRYIHAGNKYYQEVEDKHIVRAANFKGKKVLEMGVGGRNLIFDVARRSKEVVGIDVSPKSIAFIKKRKNEQKNVKFHVMDAFNTSFPNKSFDIIYSVGLMEYVAEKEFPLLLKECRRLLKPRGYFIFTAYNKTFLTRVYNLLHKMFATLSDGFPDTSEYTLRSLNKALSRNGFTLKSYRSTMYIPSKIATIFKRKHWLSNLYLNVCISCNNIAGELPFLKKWGGEFIITAKLVRK